MAVFRSRRYTFPVLSDGDRSELLLLAKESVSASCREIPLPERSYVGSLAESGAAFVTLRKRGELRGCMGHVRPVGPLWKSVRDMACSAAQRDPRFPAVAEEELSEIRIDVSVLSPFRKLSGEQDLVIGRDGLYVRRGALNGLLLPQVAVEQGWSPQEFLEQTCRKASLPPTSWKEPGTELFGFSAEIFGEKE